MPKEVLATTENLRIGDKVKRSVNWDYDDYQDAFGKSAGIVTVIQGNVAYVTWDINEHSNSYLISEEYSTLSFHIDKNTDDEVFNRIGHLL